MTPILLFDYLIVTSVAVASAFLLAIPIWILWRAAIGWIAPEQPVENTSTDIAVPGWETKEVNNQ